MNHPALTGMDPADLQALAAALEIRFAACREHDSYLRRATRRGAGTNTGHRHGGRSRIDITDHVLAWRLREHLHLTTDLAGALLGVDRTTISHATSLTRQLLAASGIPLPAAAPPPGTRPRTPDDLRDYAATAGITLTLPERGPKAPKYSRHQRIEPAAIHPT